MDVLRPTEKSDPHPGPDRLGLHGELGALPLQLRDRLIDPVDPQADMLEAEMRRLRRRGDSLVPPELVQ